MRGTNCYHGYQHVDFQTGRMSLGFSGALDWYWSGLPRVQGPRLVTDTHPDKGRTQKLLLCNLISGSIQETGACHHGLKYDAEAQCDLQPQLSLDSTTNFFDSALDGICKYCKLSLRMHVRNVDS